jgi:sugar lactone lactonase YvrE
MRTLWPRYRRLGILLLVLPGLGLQSRPGANGVKLERPIMVDANGPGSELAVVDASGNIHELRVGQSKLEEYGRIPLPPGITPADMTFSQSDGQAALLIAGTESGHGVVVRYALDGKSLKTWNFQNICSGIDFGAASNSAYVATSDSNEIFRLDLRGNDKTYVARIADATKLGPLAFDEAGQEIYVADVASGRVYQYSIAAKTSKTLVEGLSAPTAIAFDSETGRLFVADPGRRAIFTVDTRASKPDLVQFAADPLKAPYGMTLISNGRVAVADYGANSVVIFSAKGAMLFRFPPQD